MKRLLAPFFALIALIVTGCSSTGSAEQTQSASTVVNQVDPSKVEQLSILQLHEAYLDSNITHAHEDSVVDISGEVVAFELTEDNRFSVTIRNDNKDALCLFTDEIADQVGTGRVIFRGANITVRGQLGKAALFSETPFVIDGCVLVTN